MILKLLNWNIEWATASSKRGRHITGTIEQNAPDILCLTETTTKMIPSGHRIIASGDYGYENRGDRHKVALWSREAWDDVDTVGSAAWSVGRFVSGITQGVRVVGVCIPWSMSHVSTGRKDRARWQDHLAYLAGLATLLAKYRAEPYPVCVVGDYNQRLPRKWQPHNVADALIDCFEAFTIITAELTDSEGKLLIDHIALDKMNGRVTTIIPKQTENALKLSDHVGIVAELEL